MVQTAGGRAMHALPTLGAAMLMMESDTVKAIAGVILILGQQGLNA